MYKTIIFLISLFYFQTQAAIITPYVQVSGLLVSYDNDTVTLESQPEKKRFKVPKSSVKHIEGLLVGKAFVEVEVLSLELAKLNSNRKSNRPQ